MALNSDDMRAEVFRITRCLSVGPYPDADRIAYLKRIGVTHILNVASSQPSPIVAHAGFSEVVCYSIVDLTRMPEHQVIDCLNAAHRMLLARDSRLYIHCLAGQNRSPNILWLLLIAYGIEPKEAKQWIEDRTLHAVPGHELMVDDRLVAAAAHHGRTTFRPLKRPEVIEPV